MRGAVTAPIAGGGAQQVLLQVTPDLDLRAVCADHLELALQELVDPDESAGPEVDAAGGSLVAVDVGHAARRDERGVMHVAVILVHVVAAVRVDDRGPDLSDHTLDRPDHHPAVADAEAGIGELGGEQPCAEQFGGTLGLHDSFRADPARLAAGEREDVDGVAASSVAQQDPATADLHVIRMGADREDHLTLLALRAPDTAISSATFPSSAGGSMGLVRKSSALARSAATAVSRLTLAVRTRIAASGHASLASRANPSPLMPGRLTSAMIRPQSSRGSASSPSSALLTHATAASGRSSSIATSANTSSSSTNSTRGSEAEASPGSSGGDGDAPLTIY